MLEVHRDLDARFRKYVIINNITGFPANRKGRPYRHFTVRGAVRRAYRINKSLNKTMAGLARG